MPEPLKYGDVLRPMGRIGRSTPKGYIEWRVMYVAPGPVRPSDEQDHALATVSAVGPDNHYYDPGPPFWWVVPMGYWEKVPDD